MTVRENIAFGLKMRRRPKDEIAARVESVAELLDLTHLLERRPSQLSGGQQQRVGLGRALVKQPRVFLLDEPFSNLDAALRARMRTEIKHLHLRLGTTTVFVTHDQEEAMSIADRIALMDKGEVVQVATPVEMYSAPKTKFVADFIGTSNLFAGTLGTGTITVKGKTLPTPATQLASGAKAVLVVRPEDIELGSTGTISGTLVSSNFYGGSSLLFVDCGFDQLMKVSCALNEVPPVGSVCNLSWNAADSILLADA